MMVYDRDSLIVGFGAMAAGLIGLGYGIGAHCRMKKICDKLDASIEELSKEVPIDISEKVVHQAVEEAAERAARSAVNEAVSAALKQINEDVRDKVSAAVSSEYDEISKKVTDEIAKKVSKIDEDSLRSKVVEKAKDRILEKFDGKLDYLLDGFNQNLNNVSKIYGSIARSMTGNKETAFGIW